MNKNQTVPDLLSFDSWDYDASAAGSSITGSVPSFDDEANVTVSVSGALYTLDSFTFRKLANLPWQVNRQGTYMLFTAPHIFEVLLNHAIYAGFPNLQSLPSADRQELEPLALLLDFRELHAHLMKPVKKKIGGFRKVPKDEPPQRPSLLQRWGSKKKMTHQEHVAESDFVL